MKRRQFMRIAGSSLVMATAGAGLYAATRTPSKALAPWHALPSRFHDPRMRALSHAILAPNPHNRQPWLIELKRDDEVMLYCDLERLLQATDPFGRQIVIGLGCFLELLRMAAAEDGYHAELTPFPDGEPEMMLDSRPVARVRFSRSGQISPDALFRHVLARRTNKKPFDTARPIESSVLSALRSSISEPVHVNTSNDHGVIDELRDLTWRAHMVELMAPEKYQESIDLMRLGKAEIEANPDGIGIGGPTLDPMIAVGMLSREKLADPGSNAFRYGRDMFRDIMFSAMAYVWVVTDGNSRADQLRAGQAWVRINLAATAVGLGVHPMSQALQEYSEMSKLYHELHDKLGVEGSSRIQMLGRLGYGPVSLPSPRWPLETRLRTA